MFFVEEPLFDATDRSYVTVTEAQPQVYVVVPHLTDSDRSRTADVQRQLLNEMIETEGVRPGVLWSLHADVAALQRPRAGASGGVRLHG